MEYYNIEVFKDDEIKVLDTDKLEMSVYQFLKRYYTPNHSLFLYNIRKYDTGTLGETFFRDILRWFYRQYKGDRLEWLNYTMNIISAFNDDPANIWIGWELEQVLKEESSVPKLTLEDMFKDPEILKTITEKLEGKDIIKDGKWIGIIYPRTGKLNIETSLASLIFMMDKKELFKEKYLATEMHIGSNNYFKIKTGGNYFKNAKKNKTEKFNSYFNFI